MVVVVVVVAAAAETAAATAAAVVAIVAPVQLICVVFDGGWAIVACATRRVVGSVRFV